MPSKAKDARLEQKEIAEAKLNQRLAELAERNLGPQAAAKDRAVRKLRADLRKANERLSVIEGKEKKIEDMARAKEEKLKKPKKEKSKKQEAGEAQQEMSKRQKKKLEKQKDKEKQKDEPDAA
ncbi:MAG: hypothetical protein ACQET7_14450 [Thermodesulfobacteriota bacterium]